MTLATQLWQHHPVSTGENLGLQIGPLALSISHLPQEWRISYQYDSDFNQDEESLQFALQSGSNELAKVERYLFREAPGMVYIRPRLANRAVVSRPAQPIHLPAGEEITLFVSSPIWMAFSFADEQPPLLELPIIRPSDTWFGPSSFEGELCYASHTRGYTSMDEVPPRLHRAITPVLIRNHDETELLFERIAIPVPLLSLFLSDNQQLWTEELTLTREKEALMASLKIANGTPSLAGDCPLISPARQPKDKGLLYRAFTTLFN